MKVKTVKRILIAVIAILLLIAWIARFYILNRESEKTHIKIYNTGDVAPIGKNFCETGNEDNEGYEFIVKGGTVKTLEEFLNENGKDADYLQEISPGTFEPSYVYLLEVVVRNVGNTNQKGFSLVGMPLVTDNLQIQVHDELFDLLYPKLEGAYGFAVRPDTEMTMYLPFAATPGVDKYCDYDFYAKEQFYFVISWYPEEIKIRVDTKA